MFSRRLKIATRSLNFLILFSILKSQLKVGYFFVQNSSGVEEEKYERKFQETSNSQSQRRRFEALSGATCVFPFHTCYAMRGWHSHVLILRLQKIMCVLRSKITVLEILRPSYHKNNFLIS